MKTTYFKVDRAIQKHWLWEDKPFSRGQAWIDLILMASHSDNKTWFKGDLTERKRGEVHTSIGFLCDRWGWSKNKVLRFLGLLESQGMSTTKGTTKGTVITIEKYAFYQSDYTAKGITESTTEGTTESTAQGTTEGTTEGIQTIINNNDKECRRMINNLFNTDTELTNKAKVKYAEIRKKARAITEVRR